MRFLVSARLGVPPQLPAHAEVRDRSQPQPHEAAADNGQQRRDHFVIDTVQPGCHLLWYCWEDSEYQEDADARACESRRRVQPTPL
jgi:hypothetical protein